MTGWLKASLGVLAGVALGCAAAVAIEAFGGQPMGLFAGSRPTHLGFRGGQFAPPSWKPNCVSSTVDKADKHHIAPITFTGDAGAAWNKLLGIVQGRPLVTVVVQQPGYLHAEFKSAGLGFVDDVEFALDDKASVIHVRSASRLGIRDFDVNRKRVESIRAAFAQ